MIRLTLPGSLVYRDVLLRVVASSCKIVRTRSRTKQEASHDAQAFDDQVVSAVSEVFNNIAIHGYGDTPEGEVQIEIETLADGITIRLADRGKSFDFVQATSEPLPELPVNRMGLFIVRSFMDEVRYEPADAPGGVNRLTLTKHY